MKYALIILTITAIFLIPKTDVSLIKSVDRVTPTKISGDTESSALSSVSTGEAKIVKKFVPQSEVEQLICEAFGEECNTAIAIARAESGLDCTKRSYQMNTNGTYDHGLFQINDIHRSRYPDADFYDCRTNIKIAKEIRDSWHGWHAWSVFNSSSYLQFIKY